MDAVTGNAFFDLTDWEHPPHYFCHRLAPRREPYSSAGMLRWKSTLRELSAEARLHRYARSLSGETGRLLHLAALYGACAVIAAVVFGTLSVHPF